MGNKRKYIKNLYKGKKKKAWNKPTKPFPTRWKRKLAKSDKGLYYNQGKWINEHEYGNERYYNEYLHEMFFAKEKNILVSLEKLSAFINASLFANSAIILRKS